MAEIPEIKGTVKRMSPSGKGFMLNEYDGTWFNFGKGYEGPKPFLENAAITLTYEEIFKAGGSSSFFVLSAWPTTGQPGPVPPQVTPPGPKPIAGPKPTNGPTPTQPTTVAPTGPVPTPPNREQSILFQVCLKAAQEWVLAVEGLPKTPAEVLVVADLYYAQGLRLINGEALSIGEPDMPPEELPQ